MLGLLWTVPASLPWWSGRPHHESTERPCYTGRMRLENVDYRYEPGLDTIADTIRSLDRGRVLVGISGYGGAGKTTLAGALSRRLECPVVPLDAFGTSALLHRSSDWHGFDRVRLQKQVLEPFSSGCPEIRYDACDDWESWATAPVEWPVGRYLVVEGVGLFHPRQLGYLDYRIWLDVPLVRATAQGIARARELGQDTDALWQSIWEPNERDFDRIFRPREGAHRLVRPVS